MRLMMIVSGEEYTTSITDFLEQNGLRATEIGSSGDFLEYGRTIYLLGIPDQDVDIILERIKENQKNCNDSDMNYHNEVAIYVMEMASFQQIHL